MSYFEVLSHVNLLDPHAWTETAPWTTASDSTEARHGIRTAEGQDSSILEWIVGSVCVIILISVVVLALRTSHDERPARDHAPQQHYPPRPPAGRTQDRDQSLPPRPRRSPPA